MNNYEPYPFEHPIVWHVCFHRGKRFWSNEFFHVSLAGKAEDTWVHLDFHYRGVTQMVIYEHDKVQDYLAFLLRQCAVVRVPAHQPTGRGFLRPLTCVGFVKHTLGIRDSALRPDALFRSLLRKHGGVWLNAAPERTENRRDRGAETTA